MIFFCFNLIDKKQVIFTIYPSRGGDEKEKLEKSRANL